MNPSKPPVLAFRAEEAPPVPDTEQVIQIDQMSAVPPVPPSIDVRPPAVESRAQEEVSSSSDSSTSSSDSSDGSDSSSGSSDSSGSSSGSSDGSSSSGSDDSSSSSSGSSSSDDSSSLDIEIRPMGPRELGIKKGTIRRMSDERFVETYKPDSFIQPKKFKLPSDMTFTKFVDEQFNMYQLPPLPEEIDPNACQNRGDDFELFPYQRFIRDYMSRYTPYRGILVYHGLGSGKTCTSIAVAEGAQDERKVLIFLPASLTNNYKQELKSCGNSLFNRFQKWTWEPMDMSNETDRLRARAMGVPLPIIKKNSGIWNVDNEKGTPYEALTPNEQKLLNAQINVLMEEKYEFISYNGLSYKRLKEKIQTEGNWFDNRVVVIDEVHNLTRNIVSGTKIGKTIYELLCTAKNCKIIALSGTPLINVPLEIGILSNILMGETPIYRIAIDDASEEEVKVQLLSNPRIRSVDALESGSYDITLYPGGFEKDTSGTGSGGIIYREKTEFSSNQSSKVLSSLVRWCKEKGFSVVSSGSMKPSFRMAKHMPDTRDEFNSLFVNMRENKVKNSLLFQRRMLGLVSYYRGAKDEFMPKEHDLQIVNLPMSKHQMKEYDSVRAEERDKEKKAKQAGRNVPNGNDPTAEMPSSYRSRSRNVCTFALPKGDEYSRPRMGYDKDGKRNMMEWNDKEDEDEDKDAKQDYKNAIESLKDRLRTNKENFFLLEADSSSQQLKTYSPKYHAILKSIVDTESPSLVYSQFKTLEGLGTFQIACEANGFVALKLKRVAAKGKKKNVWKIANSMEELLHKKLYVEFSGSQDQEIRNITINWFNGNNKKLPHSIVEQIADMNDALKEKGSENRIDITHNRDGHMARVIMITESGAEGISLKNVRHVHVMEPYWNFVRIEQVRGRAARICSHMDLPIDERDVRTYMYVSQVYPTVEEAKDDEKMLEMIEKRKETYKAIELQDGGVSTDEYILGIATRKRMLLGEFLELLRNAAVDCFLNATENKKDPKECFVPPFQEDRPQERMYPAHFEDDEDDALLVEPKETKLYPIRIRGEDTSMPYQYFMDKDTKRVLQRTGRGEYELYATMKEDSRGRMTLKKVR